MFEADNERIKEGDIFIRVRSTKERVHPNEEITIEFSLCYKPGIHVRQNGFVESWQPDGFEYRDLEVDSRPTPEKILVDGQRYETFILKRVAVFPTRTGTLQIAPLHVDTEASAMLGWVDEGSLSPDQYETVGLVSPTLTIEVLPRPADRDNRQPSSQRENKSVSAGFRALLWAFAVFAALLISSVFVAKVQEVERYSGSKSEESTGLTEGKNPYSDEHIEARYVTAEALNVREGPGTEFGVVSSLHRGDEVLVQGSTGTWDRVIASIDSQAKGWVYRQYLAEVLVTEVQKSVWVVNDGQFLIVRANPKAEAKKVRILGGGDSLTIVGQISLYTNVTLGEVAGYVRGVESKARPTETR